MNHLLILPIQKFICTHNLKLRIHVEFMHALTNQI